MIRTTNPTISVVMSVHNAERYLHKAIESILTQSFADFEFIIIDDGSSDGSPAILREYAAKNERIRPILHENRGLTKALNEGLALARGEFVARMDADDISLPQRFERQAFYLKQHPDCVLLGSEVLLVDPEGWPICRRGHLLSHQQIDEQLLRGDGGGLTHPAVMIRTRTLREIGGYNEAMTTAQDLDLFLHLAEVGQIANLPDVLLKWRQHPASVNHTRYLTWREMKKIALSAAAQRRHIRLDLERILSVNPTAPKEVDHHAEYMEWAAAHPRYFPTALKHLTLSLAATGPQRAQLQCLISMAKRIVRIFLPRSSRRTAAPRLA